MYPFCEFTDGSGQSAHGSDFQKGWNIYVYVTGFAKTGLIAGIRNYSYSPFSSSKYFLSIYFLVQKFKI